MTMQRLLGICAAVVLSFGNIVPCAIAYAGSPPPLAAYGQLPGVEMMALSPSGERLAIVGLAENVRRLVVLDANKKPLLAIPVGDAKVRGIYWAGEDRVLIMKSETTKLDAGFSTDMTELFTMVVVPLNGDKLWSVFANDEKITGGVRGFYGIRQRDGRFYGYFGGLTYKGDFRSPVGYLTSGGPVLYEVDLQNRQSRMVAPRFENDGFRQWVLGKDGKVAATLDYISTNGTWTIRNADGTKIQEGANPLGDVGLVGLGTTVETVILSDERENGEVRWFETPLGGGASKEILADVYVHKYFTDTNTGRLIGYQQEGDTPAYTFSDPRQQKIVSAAMKAFPGLIVHLIDWSENFDRLVVMTEGADDPQTWWKIDIANGKAEEIGFSYPIDHADVGPVQVFKYNAGDGTAIEGVLTLPPGRDPKNLPVVVLPHGGPAARDYPGFDWWAQAFASRGYAVLQPNFRGSTGYGAAFQHAGNGQWGRIMQSDISDGLAALAKQGIVDPKRACIMGASYGGFAALAGVTLQHGIYRCAVSVAGVSDVARLASTNIVGSNYDKAMRHAVEQELGARRDLRAISPINFATAADAPILLIHGKDDIVVPYDQSNDMAVALQRAGKPVELVTLTDEDHWLSRSSTRQEMLEAAMRFMEQHNPADPVR